MMTSKYSFGSRATSHGLRFVCILAMAACAGLAHGEWALNGGKSSLSFVSTKASHVGEVHHFERLSGQVDATGKATLIIDLASVNTGIPIRDERMQTLLFETDRFPDASLSAEVPIEVLAGLARGESKNFTLRGKLAIHGISVPVSSEVNVIKLADDSMQVNSVRPLLVNAKNLSLLAGVERLREVAGLPGISQSVAVTFQLHFRQ